MTTVARRLTDLIETARPRLMGLTDQQVSAKPDPDKWSVKEILGHLIDSEANNLQRIVRMQEVHDIGKFGYSQRHWVESQHYHMEPWEDLVQIWYSTNRHLAHVIAHVHAGSLSNVCDMGYAKPAPLSFVIEDYVRHVEHHLGQIFGGGDPQSRDRWVARTPA